MDYKQMALVGLGVAVVAGGVAALISWRKRKKQKPDEEEVRRSAIEKLERARDDLDEAPPSFEGEAVVDPEDDGPEEMVRELDSYRVVPKQEKPELQELLDNLEEDLKKMEESPTTLWGTDSIEFDEQGRPLFKQSDFEGEEGRVEEIYQEDYNDKDDYVRYSRDTAVWFPRAGVMVNADLEPIEVVDAVGPTAFSKLISSPDGVFFVANHELMRLYELSVNELPLEEVMEEVYPTYNTSSEM